MVLFTWEDKYSVHVNLMDNQHKRLFDLINQLHTAMSEGKGNTVLADILKGLKEYTDLHFTEEERLMEKFGYTGLSGQKIEHKMFIEKIKGYEKELSEKKIGLSINVMQFLRDWLINHIQSVDSGYTDVFHSHGMK